MATSAYRDGNRTSRPVVGQRRRRPISFSIPSFLRHCPFLLPLLLIVLRNAIDESTLSFGYKAWAFHAATLVHGFHSLHRPPSTGDCYRRNLIWCNNRLRKVDRAIFQASSSMIMSSSDDGGGDKDNSDQKKIRLNKVFKRTHSRREADRLIEEGRVSINGDRVVTKGGFFVIPYVDKISLDGSVVKGWEEMNFVSNDNLNSETKGKGEPIQPPKSTRQNHNDGSGTERSTFEYIKYWKPRGVICTTDLNIPGNIIDEMREHDGYDPPHRVYPVGRLDKETTGIILLTSDGRLPNAALRKQHKRPKIYEVMVDPPIGPPGSARSNQVLDSLSTGVVISTETVRNGVRKTLTAPTEPCTVEQLTDQWIRITLKEGRNRQVRKMTRAVGHRTVELERVSFAGIPLEPGLRGPGDWDYLKEEELEIVRDMIRIAAEAQEEEDAYWESD